MKRIALSVITMVMALTVGAYATTAAWNDTVSVEGNVIRTGTADLKVSVRTDGNTPPGPNPKWVQGPSDSKFDISGLVPGGEAREYSFSLWNDGDVDFNLVGLIKDVTFSGTPVPTDLTNLKLQIVDHTTGNPVGSEYNLTQWQSSAKVLETLLSGDIHDYDIKVRLLIGASNDWQGQTVTFTMDVTGTGVAPTPAP